MADNLRHRGRKYYKRGNINHSRGIIKDRVDISERPAVVDGKSRFGDLEIDTVIGKNHPGMGTIQGQATHNNGRQWKRVRKTQGDCKRT